MFHNCWSDSYLVQTFAKAAKTYKEIVKNHENMLDENGFVFKFDVHLGF